MKKILAWLLVLTLVFSLGGTALAAEDEAAVWGSYTLAGLKTDNEEFTQETLSMMAALGMTATLEIYEDGSAVLDLFGEQEELTFDFAQWQVQVDGGWMDFSWDEGVLTMGNEDGSFTFVKGQLDPPRTRGPFRLYQMTKMVNVEGEDITKELEAQAKKGNYMLLVLFNTGEGLLNDLDGLQFPMYFDYETNKVTAEEETLPFLEKKGSIEIRGEKLRMTLTQIDPGWVGSYELTAMQSEEEGDMTDQLVMLSAMGLLPTLELQEDGKGQLDLFGAVAEGQFDFENMVMTMEGEKTPFTYDMGQLTLENDGASMTFSRVREMPELQEDAA